ncbi:MAG: phospholipase [Bacteroidia bacterium]|nr:phospholipase [Bacteroidia bacterium]
MTSLYILASIIVFFILALYLSNSIQRRKGNTRERETPLPPIDVRTKEEKDSGCCGAHEVCEKDSLIAAFKEEPEYFDDEELDRFHFRDSAGYSDKEVEEFREVFYTIVDEEKPRWVRSLQLREIAIPDQIKDEIVLIVSDMREAKMHA